MDIEIRVNAVDAQLIYVRSADTTGYTIQIADVEIRELPRWALMDLYNRIGEELGFPIFENLERAIQENRQNERDKGDGKLFDLHIKIKWSDEDEVFIAVPDWPPHMLSAHGDTPEVALKELCTVIQGVIEEGAKLPSGD